MSIESISFCNKDFQTLANWAEHNQKDKTSSLRIQKNGSLYERSISNKTTKDTSFLKRFWNAVKKFFVEGRNSGSTHQKLIQKISTILDSEVEGVLKRIHDATDLSSNPKELEHCKKIIQQEIQHLDKVASTLKLTEDKLLKQGERGAFLPKLIKTDLTKEFAKVAHSAITTTTSRVTKLWQSKIQTYLAQEFEKTIRAFGRKNGVFQLHFGSSSESSADVKYLKRAELIQTANQISKQWQLGIEVYS
ncbi:MAG: hypothetical protein P4L16_07880 [Chlamydiales bacterium]|nr:hypothetical protein [Chlamydiales bacterium]